MKSGNRFTRPSKDVPFYKANDEYMAYFRQNYLEPQNVVSMTFSQSADKLSKTSVFEWCNDTMQSSWKNDPVVVEKHLTPMAAYNAANGITETCITSSELA